jgi:VWFA-related protein
MALALAVAGAAGTFALHAQGGARPVDSGQTFRAATRLIQVSVVVHDGRNRPVAGLTANDFQLFEDGQELPAAFFTVRAAAERESTTAAAGTFSNRIESPSNGGVVAIVYDRLNTAQLDQHRVREHIVTYLGQVNPDDRVGVYVLDGRGMRVLHDFTRDARSLLRVLARVKERPSAALEASQETPLEHVGFGDALDRQLEAFVLTGQTNMRGFFERDLALKSIDGLEAVARHLAGVPGRKNLVWISSGFPFDFRAFGPPTSNQREVMSTETARAARALNDADVAVYAVDARGLVGAFATPGSAKHQSFTTLDTVLKPIEGLRQFADLTGGAAFFNTNDLGAAIKRAVDDSRLTYVLGYYTPNDTWDGKFRAIKVKVRRPGVDVRHRAGYFAIPAVLGAEDTREASIMDALESPLEATSLPFSVTARPDGDKVALRIRLEGATPTLELRDGRWHGALDVAVAQTLPSGQQTKEADVTVPLALDGAGRDQVLAQGIQLTVTFRPHDLAHDARVVVRDVASGSAGSVIIPAASLRAVRGLQER